MRSGAASRAVAAARAALGGDVESLAPVPRSSSSARRRRALRDLRASRYVERLARRRLAFAPTDPLARRSSGTSPRHARSTSGPTCPLLAARARGRDRLRHRRRPPGVRRAGSRLRGASSAAPPCRTRQGHGTFVAGMIAADDEQRRGHRRAWRSAPSCSSRRSSRPTGRSTSRPRRRRSAGRCGSGARVINLSLGGPARPAQPGARHVLAARGGRDRLRDRAGASSWSRRSATATRRRASRGPTRTIRRRCRTSSASARSPATARPRVLEPRPDLQRHRRARAGHLLDAAAGADRRRCRDVRRSGLLDLRPGEYWRQAEGTSFAAPQVTAAAAHADRRAPSTSSPSR